MHLNENNILYEHQYGFRKSNSTHMALLQVVDKIHAATNDNKFALGIFLDLHDILLAKLKHYGFQGDTLNS